MLRTTLLLALAATAVFPSFVQGQVVQEYLTGLRSPAKTLVLPDSSLLVTESGAVTTPNSGRISLVDRDGRRFTVIDGLPSGVHGSVAAGPSSVLLFERRLYVLMSSGDVSLPSPNGVERPNPSPSSPLFSCVLLLELPEGGADLPVGFALRQSAHDGVAAGAGTYLTNADGQVARLSRLLDFVDYVPAPRPDALDNVVISNPFALVGNGTRFDVVDSARNLLWTFNIGDSTPRVLTTFPPAANTIPALGPPVVDAVPTSIHAAGDDLLVGFLTGFPFGPGAARVARVNRHTGETTTVLSGLQTVLDALPVSRGRGLFYVLEYSSNFLAGAPGRLLLVEDPSRAPLVIASGLMRPTSLSQDARTGDLYVTELGAGRIVRIAAPQ